MSDADSVVVEFELTPEEWVDVAWEHSRQSAVYRKTVRDGQLILGLIIALLALLSVLSGSAFLSIAWLFGGAIAMVGFPKALAKSHRRQYQKFADDGIAHGMFGPHRVRLLDEGMLDETDAYQWLTRWHAIDRVDEGAGSFLIYTGKNSFLPIPHSAFRDSETLRAFSDRFFERVDSARSLGPAQPTDSDPDE